MEQCFATQPENVGYKTELSHFPLNKIRINLDCEN